jgi:uncharacterized oxidoreductase
MKTSGNRVLITGGASGIGLALAKAFAASGNEVVVCDWNADNLAAVKKDNPPIETLACDITSSPDREELLKKAVQRFPDLNVLVNNAGVSFRHSFLSPEPDLSGRIQREVNTNLLGPIELTRLFLPHLLRQERPVLVNISSALAYVPLSQWPLYCATKAGLHSFSQSLRFQLRGTPVEVVEVLPSYVDTDMMRDVDAPKLPPEKVAAEIIKGLGRGRREIRIGLSGALFYMSRLAPGWIFRQLNEKPPAIKKETSL